MKAPENDLETISRFGPHPTYPSGVRLDSGVEPDRVVKPHCCFGGQQCGPRLVVTDNTVLGVDPWYEFPFNQGMLCPKGVKRHLQQAHPGRLTCALARDDGAPGGFRETSYEAIRRVAGEIERIRRQHGRDAFAPLSGAGLTTEKTYLMGEFARMCPSTANIDCNGRRCFHLLRAAFARPP